MTRRGRGVQEREGGDDGAEPLLDADHHRVDVHETHRSSTDAERDQDGEAREDWGSTQHHRTPGAIRLTRRYSTQEATPEHAYTLALKEHDQEAEDREKEEHYREVEVEVLTEAVAEAVADAVNEAVTEAVQDAVHEAVHDAVVQAIEENVNFDVRANLYTLVAVTGVVLYWRGVWNTWDYLFGLSIWSEVACIATGLSIMWLIRLTNVPLAQGLPGG